MFALFLGNVNVKHVSEILLGDFNILLGTKYYNKQLLQIERVDEEVNSRIFFSDLNLL